MARVRSSRAESARHSLFLYSVICALSLETAITRMIDLEAAVAPIDRHVLPLTIAYVATITPFYHGALRHLDDYYVVTSRPEVRRSALLIDFLALFMQAILLFTLATLTADAHILARRWPYCLRSVSSGLSSTATGCWSAASDRRPASPIRPGLRVLGSRSENPDMLHTAWILNNAVWILVLLAASWIGWLTAPLSWARFVMAIALARTISDYRVSWAFYFPE